MEGGGAIHTRTNSKYPSTDRLVFLGLVGAMLVAMVIVGGSLVATAKCTPPAAADCEKSVDGRRKAGIVLLSIGSAGVLALLIIFAGYGYFRVSNARTPGVFTNVIMAILGIKIVRHRAEIL